MVFLESSAAVMVAPPPCILHSSAVGMALQVRPSLLGLPASYGTRMHANRWPPGLLSFLFDSLLSLFGSLCNLLFSLLRGFLRLLSRFLCGLLRLLHVLLLGLLGFRHLLLNSFGLLICFGFLLPPPH